MDLGAPVWRALEAPPSTEAATAREPLPAIGARTAVVALVAVLALAAIAGVAAILVIATSTGGTVLVEAADGAGPGTMAASDPASAAVPAGPAIAGDGLADPGIGAGLAGDAPTGILVDVGGAVRAPGLYRLPPGSRVGDAIAAAGGYGPQIDVLAADLQLNLAATLDDGSKIRVPSRGDPATSPASASSDAGATSPAGAIATGGTDGGPAGLVDLNHADSSQLEELPGIGPKTAAKIIAAREEQAFASINDLTTRRIVGPATFEKIQDLVTVR